MHYKDELQKIVDICKEGMTFPLPASLLIKLLYSARHEKGKPLVEFLYELIEFGFNPFKHSNEPFLRICLKNIISVCDKELSIIKIHPNESKKKNK